MQAVRSRTPEPGQLYPVGWYEPVPVLWLGRGLCLPGKTAASVLLPKPQVSICKQKSCALRFKQNKIVALRPTSSSLPGGQKPRAFPGRR